MNVQAKYAKIVFLIGVMLLYIAAVSWVYYFCPHTHTAFIRCYMEKALNVSGQPLRANEQICCSMCAMLHTSSQAPQLYIS